MGKYTSEYSSRNEDGDVRIRVDSEDLAKATGDKIVDRSDENGHKHEHHSYTIDRASGNYKEYYGGENSSDRSYNKESSSSDSDSDSDSRVICTHFFQKGMIDKNIWRADMEFTRLYLSDTTVRGYHFWAIPYVRLMRRYRFAEIIMRPLAVARATELAYRMGVVKRGSMFGRFVRLVGEPLCFCLGILAPQQDYKLLWRERKLSSNRY